MLTTEQLASGLPHVLESPAEAGRLEFIVVRPAKGEREFRGEVYVSPDGGVEGDRWRSSPDSETPDGTPDPRTQVSLMNARLLRLIAGGVELMSLAGDNLIVDFDLSDGNLAPGQRLAVGGAVVEVSDVAHNGCGSFMARYGRDVVRFVNSPEGKRLHLRGLYARVVEAGVVRVGDAVRKVAS